MESSAQSAAASQSVGSFNQTTLSIRGILTAALAGVGFYYLLAWAHTALAATPLPTGFLNFWSSWPLLGTLVFSALMSLLSYWPIAAGLGLLLALLVRHDFVYYGAVATGMFLILHAQANFEGWQALWAVGPSYWLALKLDLIINDPFGVVGRWLALPVCTWLWGSALSSDARKPR